jgi:sialic acid synthase SpsE
MIQTVAETAFAHEGDFNYLINQINLSAQAKADYIKFQVFLNKEEYFTDKHPALEKISSFMFNERQWLEIFKLSNKLGLKVLALPLNVSSLLFCEKHDQFIDIYEVHSVCFNEYALLSALSKTDKRVVLGVGGRLPQEIAKAKEILKKPEKDIILMYGFQSFPTDKVKLNLQKISQLKKVFNNEIGYADHTSFECNDFHFLNNIALSLGATLFEKHIAVEKGKERTDYETAISVDDFIEMTNQLNSTNLMLGNNDIFALNDKEILYKNREKQIVASRDIKASEKLTLDNLTFKVSEEKSDFEQIQFEDLLALKAQVDIKKNQVIKSNFISKNL